VHPDFLQTPETEEQKLYEEAIYDPRVTLLEGKYYVCYAAESRFGNIGVKLYFLCLRAVVN
jgi:predicted GH43/DUF377 family glycosyl hydrolase